MSVILCGSLIYPIWTYTQPALLALAAAYVASGMRDNGAGLFRMRDDAVHESPARLGNGGVR